MPLSFRLSPTRPNVLSLALLLAFVVFGTVHFAQDFDDTGSDLGASYLGCRLFTTHEAVGHLYSHDPTDFSSVTHDDAWQDAADAGDYTGWLHPYVQTPLWAWSLQPLCRPLHFPGFDRAFTALALLCFAALIALLSRFWAPNLRSPLATLLVLLALWFSTPFQYAMYLTQTHILYLLLTVAALLLAERRRPFVAGVLLALAAAVKLTPAVFLLYWLLTRRYRAAIAFALASVALLGAAGLFTGAGLFADYLATLHRVAHILLITENNQSLAATVMAHRYPEHELHRVRSFALPRALSLASDGLLLVSTLLGGLLDRTPRPSSAAPTPPLGAILTLVAATLFSPLAWTHYFIVLLAPVMVFANLAVSAPDRKVARLALLSAVAILALNLPPLAPDVIDLDATAVFVHPQFLAGLLCLAALLLLALRGRSQASRPALTEQTSGMTSSPPTLHRRKNASNSRTIPG